MTEQKALQIRPDPILSKPQVELAEWITSIVQKYEPIDVKDESTMGLALEAHTEIKGYLKQIEKEKLAGTEGARAWVQDVNQRVADLVDPLKKLAFTLDQRVGDYRAELKRAQLKEQARLDKLAENRQARAEAAGRPAPLPSTDCPACIWSRQVRRYGHG